MGQRRMISRDVFRSTVFIDIALRARDEMDALLAQRMLFALIALADDHGRGRAHPAVIRVEMLASVPALLERVTDEDVERWLSLYEELGVIVLYQADGARYYAFKKWSHYQRGNWRRSPSAIPAPPEGSVDDGDLLSAMREGLGREGGAARKRS